jgi:cyclopropane fatty-acyl-phospholipid synthase-like methyltransferase
VSHFFEALADHMGPTYLRYSFTKGTVNEVGFLVDVLGLAPGARVLDVGCGPGRHALELARRGFEVVGVDISQRFVDLGNEAATSEGLSARVRFVHGDARALDAVSIGSGFDAVVSLCQGGFGLVGRTEDGAADDAVLGGMASLLSSDGRLALSAFSAYFQLRHLESSDTFDASTGVNHERTSVRDAQGRELEADLWTTCFTPRELRLMVERVGLRVEHLWSVTPGDYGRHAPTVDRPEFLVVAQRHG